jgi:hypothetical protein
MPGNQAKSNSHIERFTFANIIKELFVIVFKIEYTSRSFLNSDLYRLSSFQQAAFFTIKSSKVVISFVQGDTHVGEVNDCV